jgi:hypothetical protein
MNSRKRMVGIMLIAIGLASGIFLKNVKIGLIIGLVLGLLSGGLFSSKKS